MDYGYNPLNKYLFPSLEVVDFQVTSKLGADLCKLFQSVIDYRDNLDYPADIISKTETDLATSANPVSFQESQAMREYRVNKVLSYVHTTMIPRFKKILKDDVNLVIEKVEDGHATNQASGGMSLFCNFACYLTFDQVDQAWTLIGTQTATHNRQPTNDEEGLKEMMELSKLFDPKTSRMSKTTFGKNNQRQIAVTVIFDPIAAFLAPDFLMNLTSEENLTAEELTAIMLHEIGHALTFIEHTGDLYVQHRRVNDFVRTKPTAKEFTGKDGTLDIQKTVDKFNSLRDIARSCLDAVKAIPESKGLQMNLTLTEGLILDIIQFLLSPITEYLDRFGRIGSFLENTLLSVKLVFGCMMSALAFVINTLYALQVYACIHEFKRMFFQADRNYQGGKASDTMGNANMLFLLERRADEFVVRHGFAAYQASALRKLGRIIEVNLAAGAVRYDINRYNVYLMIMTEWCVLVHVKLNVGHLVLDPITYENDYKRNLRLLQDHYAYFKKNTTPGPVQDAMLEQITILKQEIEKSKRLVDTEAGEVITNFIKNLVNPVRSITLLTDANLRNDVAKLEDRIDDLRNNPLYAAAAALRRRR